MKLLGVNLEINLIWDSSTSNAPISFRSAVQQAADILSTTILNNITVNIQVGVDSIGGQPMDAGAAGVAYPTSLYANYSQTVSQLSHAAIQNGELSLASVLPVADPSAGNFDISNAEAKAFGMINPNASGIDGATGFSSTIFTDGYSDIVDVALHELTHALGRINRDVSAGITWYDPLNLYTYSAPGILWNPVNTSTPGYFSLNAGLTNLGNFSTSDLSDFMPASDAFSAVENGMATLTSLDKSVLQSLGFLLNAAPSTTDTVSAFLAQYSANKGMAPVKLADTAANIVANLDALQSDLNGIFWITQTDSVPITITETQFTNDFGILGLLQGSVSLQVSGVAAADVPMVLQTSSVASISVSDSSANVSGYLDSLQSNIGKISSINLTDNAGLAIWWTQYVNDAGALALIQGNYTIFVANVPAADASTVLANSYVTSISVSDSAADVVANLDALEALAASGKIYPIALTDTGTPNLQINAAQFVNDITAIGDISGNYTLALTGVTDANVSAVSAALANSYVTSISVTDSAADVVANLDALQTLAASGKLASITLTDSGTPTISITASQLTQDAAALNAITSAHTLSVAATPVKFGSGNESVTLNTSGTVTLAVPEIINTSTTGTTNHLRVEFWAFSSPYTGASQTGYLLATDTLSGVIGPNQYFDPFTVTVSRTAATPPNGQYYSAVLLTEYTGASSVDNGYVVQDHWGGSANTSLFFTVQGSSWSFAAASTDTVSQLIQAYNASSLTSAVAVSDSAANVVANLDTLQTIAAAGDITSITLTDTGTPSLQISAAQFVNDITAIGDISGSYTLALTGVTDANVSAVSAALAKGYVTSISVSDSAADVVANLDALQTLAASGKLASITLTDSGTPTISITASQLTQDAAALNAIAGAHTLSVAGISSGVATFVAQQDAVDPGLVSPGIATGGNSVIGFENASFTSGNNAVVLNGPHSEYAVQVNPNGTIVLVDTANNNASVTVSGAPYLLFNGAAGESSGTYSNMFFIETSTDAQVAQLYEAAFHRQPDLLGLDYWLGQLTGGSSLQSIAQGFLVSNEFVTAMGGTPGSASANAAFISSLTPATFLTALYENVLGRAPDGPGLAYWEGQLAGGASQASVLVSFATSIENTVDTSASNGGWLIDTATGGYADAGQTMSAATVLPTAVQYHFLNLGLITPTSIAGSTTDGPLTLTAAGAVTLSSAASGYVVEMSSGFPSMTVNGNSNILYDGLGNNTIVINGNGNNLTMDKGTDQVYLLGGTNTTIGDFTPGKGSSLDVANTTSASAIQILTGSSANPVNGVSLHFGTTDYVINVGTVAATDANTVAAAINSVYSVADSAGEHATFLAQDSSGDTLVWFWGSTAGVSNGIIPAASLANTADVSHTHQVTAAELTLVATIVGVVPSNLSAANLA